MQNIYIKNLIIREIFETNYIIRMVYMVAKSHLTHLGLDKLIYVLI